MRQRVQESFSALITRPAGAIRSGRRQAVGAWHPVFLFDACVTRRQREPQHIRASPGVASRHRVDEPADIRGEHPGRRYDTIQPAELARVVTFRTALQQDGVHQAAVETHPHPHTGLGIVRLLGRYEIVELPIQMRHGEQRQHPSNGLVFGHHPRRSHLAVLADAADATADPPPHGRRRVLPRVARPG
ncbi:Uncharacterised protein [Mycobacteroides abscessus subsp. massiliense]|nr:Uncharacterised protein [Mycobacteroides abscessus subsp. massiliense]